MEEGNSPSANIGLGDPSGAGAADSGAIAGSEAPAHDPNLALVWAVGSAGAPSAPSQENPEFVQSRKRAKTLQLADVERPDRFDDDMQLESACIASRLSSKALSPAEEAELAPLVTKPADRAGLLLIRNACLRCWFNDCHHEVVVAKVLQLNTADIISYFADPAPVAAEVIRRLTKLGIINFGVFRPAVPPNPIKSGPRVLVLGAGMAGLAAARHLHQQNYRVTVLEAKDRVGGRVQTLRWNDRTADIGAMVVTGLIGNPVAFLAKQLSFELHPVQSHCPLWHADGTKVDDHVDLLLETLYNNVLGQTKACSLPPQTSLGAAFEAVLKANDLDLSTIRVEKMEKVNEIVNSVRALAQELQASLELATEVYSLIVERKGAPPETEECPNKGNPYHMCTPYCELKHDRAHLKPDRVNELGHVALSYGAFAASARPEDPTCREFQLVMPESAIELMRLYQIFRAAQVDSKVYEFRIGEAWREVQGLLRELRQDDTLSRPFSPSALDAESRSILNFHLSNLEYGNAARLENISVRNWDQDDEYGCEGAHMISTNGFDVLPNGLSAGLDIRVSHAVSSVTATAQSILIQAESPSGPVTFEADALIVTCSLGVLKELVRPERKAAFFNPPLPKYKLDAIATLGFGFIDKIVLCFEEPFWRTNQEADIFGVCHPVDTHTPGACYVFWDLYNATGHPTILAISAGRGAEEQEKNDDAQSVRLATQTLCRVFKADHEPIFSYVTRWHSDAYTRGSYSFVAKGCTGDEYDLLARPVIAGAGPRPTIFFAGEHTNRHFPATVHGAYLSGLRAAHQIACSFEQAPVAGPLVVGLPAGLPFEQKLNGVADDDAYSIASTAPESDDASIDG